MPNTLEVLEGWRKPASAGRGGRLADCSLVLATYQRPAEIGTALECIRKLPDAPGEVVVVDGSTDDRAAEVVANWAAAHDLCFHLIYVRSPAGLTRQRNVGIDASNGAHLYFLDDDCRPEPGYFHAIRRLFIEDEAGKTGAICGSPVNQMGVPLSLRWRLRLALGIAPRGEAGEYQRMGASMPLELARQFTGARRVTVLPGCAMAFRRAVVERHRFSRFFYGYSQGEDLEMSLRVGLEYELLWCGDAHVIHDHAPSGRPASAEKGRMEVRNRFFIWKRYVPDARLLDRARFWADTAYSIAYDFAVFLAHPASLAPLRHMLGSVRGALDCIIALPFPAEPAASREYDFNLAPFGMRTSPFAEAGAPGGGSDAGSAARAGGGGGT